MTVRTELPWMESLRRRAEWYRTVRRACRCSTEHGIGRCRCGAVDVLGPLCPRTVHIA
jgi:hypothetical protein